jgi:hypothetical protein
LPTRSPGQIVNTEWTLHAEVFFQVLHIWNLFPEETIDLFATRFNAQTPMFVSAYPDERAVAVDAMAMDWSSLTLYAYPPTAMIPLVLAKIISDKVTMTLIAPMFRRATWFSTLLSLAVDLPRQLPDREDLLSQPWNGPMLGNPRERLDLHAWRLSGNCIATAAFRDTLPWSQLDPFEALRSTATSPSGDSSPVGVIEGKLIPSVPLVVP